MCYLCKEGYNLAKGFLISREVKKINSIDYTIVDIIVDIIVDKDI